MKNPSNISSGESDERAEVTNDTLRIGGRYNWKHQPERLVYLGARFYPGNGFWHQFAKIEEPDVVWSEALDSDLPSFEETRACLATHPAESKACASVAKPLDDPRLQQAFGDAIEGALAFGFQGNNEPPAGHWLWRFWNIGKAEAGKACASVGVEPIAALLDEYAAAWSKRDRLHAEYLGKAMSDQTYDTFATLRDETLPALRKRLLAALASPAPSVGEPVAWRYRVGATTHFCANRLDHYFSLDEGRTYIKGEPLYATPPAAPAATETPSVPPELDVRRILLAVTPGEDGMGEEIYAESVTMVEAAMSRMGQELEEWQLGMRSLATPAPAVGAMKEEISRIHHVLKKHGKHPGRTDDRLSDLIDRALAAVGVSVQPVLAPHRLLDEQIEEALNGADFASMVTADDYLYVCARAIEDAVRKSFATPVQPVLASLSDEQIDAIVTSVMNGCFREYDHDDVRLIVRAALASSTPTTKDQS